MKGTAWMFQLSNTCNRPLLRRLNAFVAFRVELYYNCIFLGLQVPAQTIQAQRPASPLRVVGDQVYRQDPGVHPPSGHIFCDGLALYQLCGCIQYA